MDAGQHNASVGAEARPAPLRVGDLVRSVNSVYARYGIGRVLKVRGEQAKVEFQPGVFMDPPYRSETKILPMSDLQRVDTPLERMQRGQLDEHWRFLMKLQAARFLTGNKGGQLSNARTEILPHQIFAAHRVVSSPVRRFLLADEVGLGKTIECGMIWQALLQRGQANRTLIVCPSGLTTQWQEEMQDKFDQLFEIFGRDFTAVNPQIWDLKACAIASIDTLKRKEHREVLLENRNWNLIIFDEAHRLSARTYPSGKVDRTQNYRLAESLHDYTDAMLLVTATPHQGDEQHTQFRMLMQLLKDDIDFSGLDGQHLFAGQGQNYTELIIRTPKREVTDGQGKTVFRGRRTHRMSYRMFAEEQQFYDDVEEYIRNGYKLLDRLTDEKLRRAGGFLLTTFQKLNASSTAAIRCSLKGRLKRLTKERDTSKAIAPAPGDHWEDERYEGEHEERKAIEEDVVFIEDEIAQLEGLLEHKVARDKKMVKLLELIDTISTEAPRGDSEKVLIFTEYRNTQRYIVEELEAKFGRGSVAVIHGGMKLDNPADSARDVNLLWQPLAAAGAMDTPTTKRTSQRLFRDHDTVRFLVSTEAGGEGINLQFCHICINYDLPWNPMRVEQRVGRIYRYGQDKVVQVYNFFSQGTIEDKVQSYFSQRLKRAAQALARVTGEDPEEITATLSGQLENEIDPSSIYKLTLVEGDLNKQTQDEIKQAVARAQKAYEIATKSLFKDVSSYSFDTYRRDLATAVSLEDLETFTRQYLAYHNRKVQEADGFIEFLVPEVMEEDYPDERVSTATFNRQLAIRRPDAQFLALGHPFIDAMLKHVGSYDYGGITAAMQLDVEGLAGLSGYLLILVIRERIAREGDDECVFSLQPVFVSAQGKVDNAGLALLDDPAGTEVIGMPEDVPDPLKAVSIAREHLEQRAAVWDWDDDVEFVGMAWVEFA
ncbi:DEAD/DEAH box helicase family protein [bacterium]|nr:DEAD/DEAH box helicase family protein [bacterium]